MDADLSSQILDVEEQLVMAEMRGRTVIGGLNAIKIRTSPVYFLIQSQLSIQALNFDPSEWDYCIIDEGMIKLSHFRDQLLRNFEDIDATVNRHLAFLNFPEEIYDITELISSSPSLFHHVLVEDRLIRTIHKHVDDHIVLELKGFLTCSVDQLHFFLVVQRAIVMLLNIPLGVKLVDMCFFDPRRKLKLCILFHVEKTKDVTLFHFLIEAIEKRNEEIMIMIYNHYQMTEILLAAEDVLEVPVQLQSAASLVVDVEKILFLDEHVLVIIISKNRSFGDQRARVMAVSSSVS